MNKARIEKLWKSVRSRGLSTWFEGQADFVELLEALLDEGEPPDHPGNTGTVA